MTRIPQPSKRPDDVAGRPEGDAPARTFEPILSDPVSRPSRKPLIFLGLSILVLIGGLIFCSGKPDAAEATSPKLEVGKMTAEELAKDASPSAARELARRMVRGTPGEHAAASGAINCWSSPRLARNMAMAMALEVQKRPQEMVRQMEMNQRMMMEGH